MFLIKESDSLNIFITHKETRVLMSPDEIVIVVEGVLMTNLGREQLADTVVTFLAHYYLLDVGYYPQWELFLTILQFLSFGDLQAPLTLCRLSTTIGNSYKTLVFNGTSKRANFKYQRFL